MADASRVLVDAKGVKKYFATGGFWAEKRAPVKAVDDVSIAIRSEETYGLVGESGCGKSTFGRTILRLLEPTAGEILVGGENLASLTPGQMRGWRRRMQMIFQDPYTSLNPRKKVGHILEETLAIHKIGDPKERMETSLEILHKVGLQPEHYYRYFIRVAVCVTACPAP